MTNVTLKVTNITDSPQVVHTVDGSKIIPVGRDLDADFSEGEARNIRDNTAVFSVDGKVADGTVVQPIPATDTAQLERLQTMFAGIRPVAERLHASPELFAIKVTEALDGLDAARAELKAIADLFGTFEVDELIDFKSAVERLMQDYDAMRKRSAGSLSAEELAALERKPTLAEAIKSLDDANDAHWIGSGQPDLDTLKLLTGANVTRAMIDQLPAADKRERVKPA